MSRFIGNFLKITFLTVAFSSAVNAGHDNGLGKSQDNPNDPLHSISVAPEPSTIWLLLTGALMIAAFGRRKSKQSL
jgi:hypothetical protein